MTRIVKKPEVRRKEIVLAAKEFFIEKDYVRTSMQDIMNKLEIAKGTIYHYFKSKEELLEAVVQDIADEYLAEVREVLAKSKSKGNALNRMQALMNASNVDGKLKKLLQQLHRPDNIGMHSRLLAITITKLAPLYAKVIEQGCGEGLFHVEYPFESAEFLLAGIQFLTDVGCYPWSQEDLSRRKIAIPTLFEAQLNATKDSFNFLLKSMD